MIRPFEIHVCPSKLQRIWDRIDGFRWDDFPDAGAWDAGAAVDEVRRLVQYWRTEYDWQACEQKLNAAPHFVADIEGQRLHFVHKRGDGSRAPIMLIHGWPGSFLEFEHTADALVAVGHDVVIPSLPGYAFSGRPAHAIGPRRTATLFHGLMSALYGNRRYYIQGGDWGSLVTVWMAHAFPNAVAAIHLNMVSVHAVDALPDDPAGKAWSDRKAQLTFPETGYSHLQGTQPQTLAFAMMDNPVGIAAWIIEKFYRWSDRSSASSPASLVSVFSDEFLITNIMLYVIDDAFITSTWFYKGCFGEGSFQFPAGTRIDTPTGVVAFPDPAFPPPPRSYVEKTYNIVHWTDPATGGHFAATEQPTAWANDVLTFLKTQSDRA